MRVLGIDQSLSSTGFVVLEDSNLLYVERFGTQKEDGQYSRIYDVCVRCSEIANKFKVDFAALEGISFSSLGNATRDLAGLHYAIYIELHFKHKYGVYVVAPNRLKKFATGKGNCAKEFMYEHLPKVIKEEFVNRDYKKSKGLYDVTDAYWIARYLEETIKEEA
jgi:crossover junction endodeoxyribonuclease RuvC